VIEAAHDQLLQRGVNHEWGGKGFICLPHSALTNIFSSVEAEDIIAKKKLTLYQRLISDGAKFLRFLICHGVDIVSCKGFPPKSTDTVILMTLVCLSKS